MGCDKSRSHDKGFGDETFRIDRFFYGGSRAVGSGGRIRHRPLPAHGFHPLDTRRDFYCIALALFLIANTGSKPFSTFFPGAV
jgi:hypothetical protein